MKTFHIGYMQGTGEYRVFNTLAEAEDVADDWLSIDANTAEEAIAQYEVRFAEFKEANK